MTKCTHKSGRTCILDGCIPTKADCAECKNYEPEEKGAMTVLDWLPTLGSSRAAEEIHRRSDWPASKIEAWLREPWRGK